MTTDDLASEFPRASSPVVAGKDGEVAEARHYCVDPVTPDDPQYVGRHWRRFFVTPVRGG